MFANGAHIIAGLEDATAMFDLAIYKIIMPMSDAVKKRNIALRNASRNKLAANPLTQLNSGRFSECDSLTPSAFTSAAV